MMTYYDNVDDHMEVGNLIPVGEGKWMDRDTGYIIDEEGFVFDEKGNIIDEGYYGNDG